MNAKSILKHRFRISPLFTLREWNELNYQEKELISELHDEMEVYGLFSPTVPTPSLSTKVAYRELAFVYLHLLHNGLLPHYATLLPEDSFSKAIAQLVLDQVFEIEWNGKFVSGTGAVEALFGKSIFDDNLVPDYLGLLSKQGIEYALYLDNVDMRIIANRLYTFNTQPCDSSVKKIFAEESDTRDFVFSLSQKGTGSLLNNEWHLLSDPLKDHWLGWTRHHFKDSPPVQKDNSTYKLYISPVIQDMPGVMAVVLPVLSSSDAFHFKIGNGIQGLLRPDKMVAYFDNKSSLLAVAGELKDKLNGFTTQGVPFTAQADDRGILSWGVDPPDTDVLESVEGGSWRCRVTDLLSLGIMQAKAENLDQEQSIILISSRLYVAGIHPLKWMPLN